MKSRRRVRPRVAAGEEAPAPTLSKTRQMGIAAFTGKSACGGTPLDRARCADSAVSAASLPKSPQLPPMAGASLGSGAIGSPARSAGRLSPRLPSFQGNPFGKIYREAIGKPNTTQVAPEP